jgi:tRNA(Arg) A34 adenosine deaminase TadA
MLMALWMETFPHEPPKTNDSRPTGCLLVSPQDRILGMEHNGERYGLQHNGESHAIVRAILNSTVDPLGCDIYVSRYPCALCVKIMVQAGIRKAYYFPAHDW